MTSYDKTASKPRRRKGYYAAIVTQVDGEDVYVRVPRLSDEFEHGPIPYVGAVPEVGADVFVGFLADDPDTLMAVFPGGADGGVIEDTYYIVAEGYERYELELMADYLVTSDSDYDATEILQTVVSLLSQADYGRILLSRGAFQLTAPIVGWIEGFTIQGAGKFDTWIEAAGDMGAVDDLDGASGMLEIGGTGMYRDLYIGCDWEEFLPPPNYYSHAAVWTRSFNFGGTKFDNVYFDIWGAWEENEYGYEVNSAIYSDNLDVSLINCELYSYDGAGVHGDTVRVESSYVDVRKHAVYADYAMLTSSRLLSTHGVTVYSGDIVASDCYFEQYAPYGEDEFNDNCVEIWNGIMVLNSCSFVSGGPGYPVDDPESNCVYAPYCLNLVVRSCTFYQGTRHIYFDPRTDAASAVITGNTFYYAENGSILVDGTARVNYTYGTVSVTGNMFADQYGPSLETRYIDEVIFSDNSIEVASYQRGQDANGWSMVKIGNAESFIIAGNEMVDV